MKTREFTKDSWPVKFCYTMNGEKPWNQEGETDICAFGRAFFWASVKALALATMVVVITIGVSDFLAWIAAMIITGMILPPGNIAAITGMILILTGIKFHTDRKQQKRQELFEKLQDINYVAPEPSILQAWYESFKNKTCFKIKFK